MTLWSQFFLELVVDRDLLFLAVFLFEPDQGAFSAFEIASPPAVIGKIGGTKEGTGQIRGGLEKGRRLKHGVLCQCKIYRRNSVKMR